MTDRTSRPRPVVLCILDGWGHRTDPDHNAILDARTPTWDRFMATCPHALLDASELEVGLPSGQMGNSEVGHMNLGAGRVVLQELVRIDKAVADGSIAKTAALQDLIAKLKKSGGTAHVMGLLSPGGVHSHQDHIAALVKALASAGVPVRIHAFLDGRDTPPKSALEYLAAFEKSIAGAKGAQIATVGGRYYAMDRDKRWERVSLAYAALVDAKGERAATGRAAVDAGYAAGTSDEFVKPTVVGDYAGMTDGDGVLMANFRADRAREILTALLDPKFDGFARDRVVKFAGAAGLVEYSDKLNAFLATLFPPQRLTHVMGEVVADAGLKQLRIAETEKYAHVTFFFNGGEEGEFAGEERILVPSPKVATYDLKPEMSAFEVTDKLVAAIDSGKFDFVVVNYANTDMVGHTGDLAAAIKAVEAVDTCLGRLDTAVRKAGGVLLVTADHGNAEQMIDRQTGQPHTAHTLNLVPVVLVGAGKVALSNGRLADVAPTLLEIMGLKRPAEMTGKVLIAPADARRDGERRATA
ncbi:MAG: 2,3-bisphosphoglycerate-independent phosphoglycerate mutase [Candidatus Eiseniibacteriota bacterium]